MRDMEYRSSDFGTIDVQDAQIRLWRGQNAVLLTWLGVKLGTVIESTKVTRTENPNKRPRSSTLRFIEQEQNVIVLPRRPIRMGPSQRLILEETDRLKRVKETSSAVHYPSDVEAKLCLQYQDGANFILFKVTDLREGGSIIKPEVQDIISQAISGYGTMPCYGQ